MEAEAGVTQPLPRSFQEPPGAGGEAGFSPRALGRNKTQLPSDLGLLSSGDPAVLPTALGHQVCGRSDGGHRKRTRRLSSPSRHSK